MGKSLVSQFSPFGPPASAQRFYFFLLLQPAQNLADQIQADTGPFSLQVSHAEGADLTANRRQHRLALFTAPRSEMSDALLKLPAGLHEDQQQQTHGRPPII